MLHYLDIRLLTDPELAPHQLMSHLFSRVHQRMARGQFTQVAVSFPGYALTPATLGKTLRLIGPADALTAFMANDWLAALRDHVSLTDLQPVPADAKPYRLRRVQAKSSPERLRRRQMRRHGLSAEAARARIPDQCAERLSLPFVTVPSSSTGQQFHLFLQWTPSTEGEQPGHFNAYGLSSQATTPQF
ncbi:type I-F CRISPR-associated endoribonuclease Cas6/Csy4 [Ideonella sp.]|uniref:type I-F CRISPR-associated endoribonuclease Cas6/Csy4 n=1 Tax=Ideonella sp. TaxID=1929293 RepID=UPI003BB57752